jgi:hypothetical protein
MHLGARLLSLAVIVAANVPIGDARAAENATGIYLLGSKTAMSGFVPPPGLYFTDLNYYYAGSAGGQAAAGIALRKTGAVLNIQADIDVDANAYVNMPFALWIAPHKVFGGNVGLGVIAPAGWKQIDVDIDAFAQVTLPNGTVIDANRHFDLTEDTTAFGDPLFNALIGWHQGNWHWNVGALVNIPVGPWDTDSITNLSFHRWAVDTTGAVTYLDPASGFEASAAAGFTFNWENPSTDYKTGTEFHVEAALIQHLSQTFSIGVAGYHYQQVTGDSGAGATLGSFEGQVSALGPVMNATFMVRQTPIATQLEWMHEFEAVNRAEGDMVMFNVTIPLSAVGP